MRSEKEMSALSFMSMTVSELIILTRESQQMENGYDVKDSIILSLQRVDSQNLRHLFLFMLTTFFYLVIVTGNQRSGILRLFPASRINP